MSPALEVQVVEFGIGEEVFAVPVGLVREILDHKPPFQVPNGPNYFLGLTDVRGQGFPRSTCGSGWGLRPPSRRCRRAS